MMVFALTTAAATLLVPERCSFAAPTRPSILLITIDTVRPDGFPFSGYNRDTAPFLTKLAAGSQRFESAYSTSSWTVPAVTSLMTGLYQRSHGVAHGVLRSGAIYNQEMIADSQPTFPEELKKLGYRTFGVASNAHLAPELGYGRGFDRYLCIGIKPAEDVNATFLGWKADVESGGGPVFVWLHYYDPHHPYLQQSAFKEFVTELSADDRRLMAQATGSPPVLPRDATRRDRFITLARGLYDSEIRHVDDQIAALFRAMPGLDDYLIVVTGDHGEEFLDHGNLTHCHNLYQETVGIPLFVRGPGNAPAGSTSQIVSLVDLAPTLVSIAGGKAPASWSGIPIFDARGVPARVPADRAVLAELDRNPESGSQQSLITGRWKLIRNRKTGRVEIYDRQADRADRTNLATSEVATLAGLEKQLEQFVGSLPAPPKAMARRPVSKKTEIELKGQGYIH